MRRGSRASFFTAEGGVRGDPRRKTLSPQRHRDTEKNGKQNDVGKVCGGGEVLDGERARRTALAFA
jgi:hypothetical protein